jgi:LacI family transcriptional regulator
MKTSTIHDIARHAGVSVGTVSHVLNGKGNVSLRRVEAVRQAMVELGYRPNANAASLRSQQTGVIALLVPTLENAFFAEILMAVETCAARENRSVMFMTTGENPERARHQVQELVSRRVDGLLIAPSFDYLPLLDELEKFKIPVVLIDRVERDNAFPSVAVDNENACYVGAKHLFSLGLRDVMFISHGQSFWILNQREEGFIRAAREASACESCEVHKLSLDIDEISRQAHTLLAARSHPPEAIFMSSNLAAKGVLPALRELGPDYSSNIALLAMDDFEALSLLAPSISVVRQPSSEIAETAWTMLRTLIDGEILADRHIRIPAALIIRESTSRMGGQYQRKAFV